MNCDKFTLTVIPNTHL